MTKEEALAELNRKTTDIGCEECFGEHLDSKYIEDYEVEKLLNTIYDSVESRVCKNCKHKNPFNECLEIPTQVEGSSYLDNKKQMHLEVKDNFGCNKFKQKGN